MANGWTVGKQDVKYVLKEFQLFFRGKYFAERTSICDGHFWCALGQNSWFLVRKLQNSDNFMENDKSKISFWLKTF